MLKSFLQLFIFCLLVFSCSSPDPICGCIEAGNELNKKAHSILENGSIDRLSDRSHQSNLKDETELKRLKKEKKKACKEFETMGGEEMKKRMEECN